ncbi:alginate export family protein [Desulfurobacterium thermolithotrophum]|uniref:alginate export family protein n=1 Tax=Desulfurobacterium thermolithotrophum TaxID=64160 RepID=UPI0013D11CFA|nr:alginate export family protein [Desulfurobacterium thermolithotrophum]
MRKALKVATLMGLAAALIVPSASSKAADDMEMGNTKVTIGGELRERIEWYANDVGTGNGKDIYIPIRAKLKLKAELSDGVSAVFVPEWAYNAGVLSNGVYTDQRSTGSMYIHEAYFLLSNPFGINNVIVKAGRQEVNLGNERLVSSNDWFQGDRSLDGILLGYVAGDYGLAGFFYGKLNDNNDLTVPSNPYGDPNMDLYIATWQGSFKPFGFGGTYELTDIYINPTVANFDLNTIYARVTPEVDVEFGKVKANVEGAWQQGNAGTSSADFKGYMYSVGAGADLNYAWNPSVFIGYDVYSGDDNGNDVKAFLAPLPNVDKFLGAYDQFDQSVGAALAGSSSFVVEGIKDLYVKVAANPMDKVGLSFGYHYLKSDKDFSNGGNNIGWEVDLGASYEYSKNLCFEAGWSHLNPDKDYANDYLNGEDKAGDWIYTQATVKF